MELLLLIFYFYIDIDITFSYMSKLFESMGGQMIGRLPS
jgi:hypothetical protein